MSQPKERLRSSKKRGLAVAPPKFAKIEAKDHGGMITAAQRTDVQVVDLLMDYELDGVQLKAGVTKIVLAGDAGLAPWCKKRLYVGGIEFALCPESEVIAFTTGDQ